MEDDFNPLESMNLISIKIKNDMMNIEMIYIKGGTFQMGSDKGDIDEMPLHNVTLNDFYLAKYVITQLQWEIVMGYNPSEYKGDNLPLERVNLWVVQDFLLKLNSKYGLTYRLPSEAEWEFAAKGGTKSCDYMYAGSDNLDNVAWYNNNSNGTTHQVGCKQPNELGLYDMSGNVAEWCNDYYGEYSSNSQLNPKGAPSNYMGVIRGGNCFSQSNRCRVSKRSYNMRSSVCSETGFRVVLDSMY